MHATGRPFETGSDFYSSRARFSRLQRDARIYLLQASSCDRSDRHWFLGILCRAISDLVGKPAPWFVLAILLLAGTLAALYIESCGMFVRGGRLLHRQRGDGLHAGKTLRFGTPACLPACIWLDC
jgi:hypothetical protein